MPALSFHFGLSPADVWDLDAGEYAAYQRALDEVTRSMSR